MADHNNTIGVFYLRPWGLPDAPQEAPAQDISLTGRGGEGADADARSRSHHSVSCHIVSYHIISYHTTSRYSDPRRSASPEVGVRARFRSRRRLTFDSSSRARHTLVPPPGPRFEPPPPNLDAEHGRKLYDLWLSDSWTERRHGSGSGAAQARRYNMI